MSRRRSEPLLLELDLSRGLLETPPSSPLRVRGRQVPVLRGLVDALAGSRLNPRWPLGVGALSIMLGIGTSLALWLSGDEYHRQIWSLGLIGIFLGIGLFLHYLLTRPRA